MYALDNVNEKNLLKLTGLGSAVAEGVNEAISQAKVVMREEVNAMFERIKFDPDIKQNPVDFWHNGEVPLELIGFTFCLFPQYKNRPLKYKNWSLKTYFDWIYSTSEDLKIEWNKNHPMLEAKQYKNKDIDDLNIILLKDGRFLICVYGSNLPHSLEMRSIMAAKTTFQICPPKLTENQYMPNISVRNVHLYNKFDISEYPYVIYGHEILCNPGIAKSKGLPEFPRYIGLTRQGWNKRWQQHHNAAKRGSKLLFHKALRELAPGNYIEHHVINMVKTEKEAMDFEEKYVAGEIGNNFWSCDPDNRISNFGTLYPNGLNMIPGGYAGLRKLHELGALADRKPVTLENRDNILERYVERESRTNPLVSALWNNPEYAEAIICKPEGRLKPDQIQKGRLMNMMGRNVEEICEAIEAKNQEQVKNMLAGRTYSRIKT